MPPYIFGIGHYLDLKDPTKILHNISRHIYKYGGIIRMTIGHLKPSIIVANKDFIKFLNQNSKYTIKSTYYSFVKSWLGDGLFTSEGDYWRTRRRLLIPYFSQTSILKSFLNTFESKSDKLVTIFEKQIDQEIDVLPRMKRFALDLLCGTVMGVDLNIQDNENCKYFKSVETLCDGYFNRSISLIKMFDWIYKLTDDYRREQEAIRICDEFFTELVNEKISKGNNNQSSQINMLELLMDEEIDGKKLSVKDMREHVNTILFGGFDTSASVLSFATYEIAANSNVQNKLIEEQKRIFDNVKNPNVTYEIFEQMVYLDLVLKEVFRLYALAPILGKKITKNIHFGDILIPKGINALVCSYALHRHPEYFSHPEKFIPERFENKNSIDPCTYIPFGIKPRICVGQRFAILELKSALSKLIRNFEFIKVPGHELVLTPKIVLTSNSGMWVKFKKR